VNSGLDALQDQFDALSSRLDSVVKAQDELRQQLESSPDPDRVRELERIANRDPSTDLPIMHQFFSRFGQIVAHADGEPPGVQHALGLLRLDRDYASIRNSRDRNRVLLFKTADRLRQLLGDMVFQSDRFDEFIVVLRGVSGADSIRTRAQTLFEAVRRPHAPPANDITFGAHMGFAVYPGQGTTHEELMGNAEIALETATRSDRRIVVYDEELGDTSREQDRLEHELRQISRTGFEHFWIAWQPFVDRDREIRGAESLMRWQHPVLGPISPGRFIPIAEEGGAIRYLGQWSLYQSCRQLRELPAAAREGRYISVNLSPLQFKQRDLVQRVEGILQSTELEPAQLSLEVTETIVMDDPVDAIDKMRAIKSLGVHLALDDFGTGYSSLSYLGKFQFDTLKIDRSFVDGVDRSESGQQLLRTMISLAKAFGMKALAEGVERQEELDFLWSEGCDLVQGYYFSPPRPMAEFQKLLENGLP
jgi:EAL domain-containing protein (putative c-di-GMP-specific phosphodiesterase class I)/GGDEF domain-containing protein